MAVEPSESCCHFMIKTLNFDRSIVINSQYLEADIKKKFDIIILNHVLEHFVELESVIKRLAENLKTKGKLLIRVPNYDSFDRRAYGEKWPAYLPFHIHYFSRKSLVLLFSKYGFDVMQIDEYFSDKYLEKFPKSIRKLFLRVLMILSKNFVEKFNGRTITFLLSKRKE